MPMSRARNSGSSSSTGPQSSTVAPSAGRSGSSSSMRSRNCSASAASSATCSFSTSTERSALPFRAWMTNVRSPGTPNAPAPMASTGSNSMWSVIVALRRLGEQVAEAARVVALHEHGAIGVEVEDGRGGGRDVYALEQVKVHAGVVRDRRLDRIGVAHDDDGLVRMRGDHVVERADSARLHLANRLAVGEPRARRRDLNDAPLVGLREVGDLAAGPVAVVGFDDAG